MAFAESDTCARLSLRCMGTAIGGLICTLHTVGQARSRVMFMYNSISMSQPQQHFRQISCEGRMHWLQACRRH